jgi:AcrR family transcriptional regulator
MSGRATNPVRKARADAVRNRERLLKAAADIFSVGGPDASLEAVAKRAGVGIGTLYRHFPTREALFEAVYRREVDQLSELAERLTNESEPVEALRRWLHANVRLVATKKGMVAALALAAHRPSELHAYSADRLTKAVGSLLDRAAKAGEIRTDITPEDLLRALVGMSYSVYDTPDWRRTRHLRRWPPQTLTALQPPRARKGRTPPIDRHDERARCNGLRPMVALDGCATNGSSRRGGERVAGPRGN